MITTKPTLDALGRCREVLEKFLSDMDDTQSAITHIEDELKKTVAMYQEQAKSEQENIASLMIEKDQVLARLRDNETEVKAQLAIEERELERVRSIIADLKRQITGL